MQIKQMTPPTVVPLAPDENPIRYDFKDHGAAVSHVETKAESEDKKSATDNPEKSRFARIYDLIKKADEKKSNKKENDSRRKRAIKGYKDVVALQASVKFKGDALDREG